MHNPSRQASAAISDKLTTLLSALSKVALNRLRKYLLSPYLNDQPDVARLFDLLQESLRNGTPLEHLSKLVLWKALYPRVAFNDAHFRRLCSDLTQLTMKFMAAEARQDRPMDELLEMQRLLDQPQWQKHLNGVERSLTRMIAEQTQQSTALFLTAFHMHHQIFSRASKVVATAGYIDKLAPADHYLECFYLTQKLKYYIAWLQYTGIRQTEKNVPLMPGFWAYLEDPRFRSVPLIVVFKQVVACFSDQSNEQYFKDFLHALEFYSPELTEENLRECYYMAQNYCALKINQGRTDYYQVYFNLQKKMVQLNLLLENGALSEGAFKNMITIGLRVGEFAWTEQFINEYYPYLPSNIRENARTFNLANLYSHQKQHDRVIELLSNVEYSDLVYALGAKLILLRTYYESDELLALDSLMDSFRIFIRRNKLMSKSLKREYNNFLAMLAKLAACKVEARRNLAPLKRKVAESQHITSKKWLLEKIDELDKRA